MASQVICVCDSHLLRLLFILFFPALLLIFVLLIYFYCFASCLIASSAARYALCLLRGTHLPLLSVLLVFYLNPNMLPHHEEAFCLPGPSLPNNNLFFNLLACMLESFLMFHNENKYRIHICVLSPNRFYNQNKCTIRAPFLQFTVTNSAPDVVIVKLPAERCNHRPRCIHFSELLLSCTANQRRSSPSCTYSTGEGDNPGLNVSVTQNSYF